MTLEEIDLNSHTVGEITLIKHRRHKWCACPLCGEERWVSLNRINNLPTYTGICRHCIGIQRLYSVRTFVKVEGKYGRVYLPPDDPYFPMANVDHYVPTHRFIMAEHLGRCLESNEIVHHRNHNKGDNRIKNLLLMSKHDHHPWLDVSVKVESLEKEIQKLREEVRLLLWLIKEGQSQKEGVPSH